MRRGSTYSLSWVRLLPALRFTIDQRFRPPDESEMTRGVVLSCKV